MYYLYLIVFGLFSLLGVVHAHSSNNILKSACLFLFFVVFLSFYSFSHSTGSDWIAYKPWYDGLARFGFMESFERSWSFEPFFHTLAFAMSKLGFNYQAFIVLLSFGTVLFYYDIFTRLCKKYALLVLSLFIILYGNRLFMSTLRQNVATVLLFYTYYLYMNKNKKWIFCFVVAIMFHFTAIVFIIVAILDKMKISKMTFIVATLICAIIAVLDINPFGHFVNFILPLLPQNGVLAIASKYITRSLQDNLIIGVHTRLFYIALLGFVVVQSKKMTLFHILAFLLVFIMVFFPTIHPMFNRLRYYFGIGFIYLLINESNFAKNMQPIKLMLIYAFCVTMNLNTYYFTDTYMRNNYQYNNYLIYKMKFPHIDPYSK